MIIYNMRYRGPYEYDKFVLNTFQIANESKSLKKRIDEKVAESVKNCKAIEDMYDQLTKENCIGEQLRAKLLKKG